jgi:N-acetyl-gamma-glutamyl-phosphate reductase
MANVAVGGATGYGGIELIRLLLAHPQVDLTFLSSETYAGQQVCDVHPHLPSAKGILRALDPAAMARECDYALLALPPGKSMEIVPQLLGAGVRVVDVGPDYRLRDTDLYPKWYDLSHTSAELSAEAVLGVPEVHRERIAAARLVACPGCYSTAAVLAMAPLVAEGLIDVTDIVLDGKSGISGAGRTALKLPYHFPEANETVNAYAVGGHRHLPEMVQELQALTDATVSVTFVPHLVPMTRGILMTAYVKPTVETEADALRDAMQRRYEDEAFVHVLPDGQWPQTKWVQGTNLCLLGVGIHQASGKAIIVSAIDNLGKGMAGQMVQCLNLMLGVDESTGLTARSVCP